MNFEFFAFLVFMSFVSFAVAFLAYAMVARCMGKESWASKISQVVLVPACVVIFNFITIAAPASYRYVVGSAPLILVACIFFYFRFFRGADVYGGAPTPSQAANISREPKKFSKKSARIHEARKSRGRE
ncbi:MAG: hypothetical protein SPI71_06705 [Acidaminococcaceae bacterium]|nr:hypothetical protein [Acidaminococcaceae bacterium]